jgi:hypothetical protein
VITLMRAGQGSAKLRKDVGPNRRTGRCEREGRPDPPTRCRARTPHHEWLKAQRRRA